MTFKATPSIEYVNDDNDIELVKLSVKIALVIAEKQNSITSSLIGWWTRSPYSHAELIVGNRWISSRIVTGVRVFDLRPLNDEVYDYIDLGDIYITKRQLEVFNNWVDYAITLPYDKTGIVFSQFFPFSLDAKNKFFCSEVVCKLLQILGYEEVINKRPQNVSPGDLARIFKFK